MTDKGAEYRAKGKVHDMRRRQSTVKKGKAKAAEAERKKTFRSRAGAALEKGMITETGKRVARTLGGNLDESKKKNKGAGFGSPMSIPPAGGTTERVHGQGFDKATRKLNTKEKAS